MRFVDNSSLKIMSYPAIFKNRLKTLADWLKFRIDHASRHIRDACKKWKNAFSGRNTRL